MIPIYQTINGPKGNCYEACLASILELKLEEVPIFNGPKWYKLAEEWALKENIQLKFIINIESIYNQPYPDKYAIAGLRTISNFTHSVVVKGYNIIHDPSPRSFSHISFPVLLWTIIGDIDEKTSI